MARCDYRTTIDVAHRFGGRTLLEHLEAVPTDTMADAAKPFRMPVQWVNRPN